MQTLTTEAAAAWVLRRVGFGATGSDLDHAAAVGVDAFLDELFDPDGHGVADDGDPWAELQPADRVDSNADLLVPVRAWIDRMVVHRRPVTEWLTWYWHGHLVSSAGTVRSPLALVEQLRLFRAAGTGPFPELLRAITVDRAMLRYLDGTESTGGAPNENYSRELLELFALGVGAYTEADVAAGAAALTGWTARRGRDVEFAPRRHDDTPQRYLGVEGVHDVDTVVAAVVANPACPRFVAGRIAASVLGPGVASEAAASTAGAFAADGLRVGPLVRHLVDLGLDGMTEPVVLGPVAWTVWALRCTRATPDPRRLFRALRAAGQVPLFPPNVAGWPPGDEWLSTSATTARLGVAIDVAEAADPAGPARLAADTGDLDALARALGRPEGFSAVTADALDATGTAGAALLALALCAPEMVVA